MEEFVKPKPFLETRAERVQNPYFFVVSLRPLPSRADKELV
jgi:hypothetical protein